MFEVLHIKILTGNGPDVLLIQTDLPPGVYPYKGNLIMRAEVSKGLGEDYTRAHFQDVPYEVYSKGEN